MTLVVCEASKFGIAMAADSAITQTFHQSLKLTSGCPVPPNVMIGAQKLVPIRSINAAVAVWGFGAVGMPKQFNKPEVNIPIDQFLIDFSNTVSDKETLEDVGNRLAVLIEERLSDKDHGGIHICGYARENGIEFPALYHIHSRPLQLHRDYPFQEGWTVSKWLEILQNLKDDAFFQICNGAYEPYKHLNAHLYTMMQSLKTEYNFVCPELTRFSSPLEARGRFLKLSVEIICEFYSMSNRIESIARPVSWITISPEGIQHFEPSSFAGETLKRDYDI